MNDRDYDWFVVYDIIYGFICINDVLMLITPFYISPWSFLSFINWHQRATISTGNPAGFSHDFLMGQSGQSIEKGATFRQWTCGNP